MSRLRTFWCRVRGHAWGEWEYIQPQLCEQHRQCSRCGVVAPPRVFHARGEWNTQPKAQNMEVECTRRCNARSFGVIYSVEEGVFIAKLCPGRIEEWLALIIRDQLVRLLNTQNAIRLISRTSIT